MIKVFHILSDSNIGGAGTLLINYLKNFDREQFDIKVILPQGSLLTPRITELGYEVIEIDGIKDRSMDLKAIGILQKLFRKERPHIVHAHSSMSAKIAALLAGVPSRMYTRHCSYDPPKSATVFPGKQLCGLVNNTLSTKIIAVAEAAKQNLVDTGVSEKKISVIINGVDALTPPSAERIAALKSQYGIEEGDFVYGIVARLEEVKGQQYFIEAANRLAKTYKDMKFLIAGIGTNEEKYKAMAKGNEQIIFTGFIENVAEIFSVMDVNVNCSFGTETSSLALSEGMSLGKPAIASIYGGNPYMVQNGYNGFLCEKQNTDALVAEMEKFYLDRELHQKMSQNARAAYEEKFTAAKMTRQLEEIYRQEYQARVK